MSTAVSEIIVQAFREGNYTAVGENTTAEELAEAVPRLNNYIAALIGTDLGEQYRDWYVPQVWDPEQPLRHPLTPTGTNEPTPEPWAYPPANVRLMVRIDAPRTIYFPANPMDGARMAFVGLGSQAGAVVTLSGNGRLIEGELSLIEDVANEFTGRSWMYRADLGDWIRLRFDLAPADPVPLPPEFDDLLVTGLCVRLAPRYGVKEIDAAIIERRNEMLAKLKRRYKQSERIPTSIEMRSMFREL